jgi:hypothetical protein
VILSEPNPTDFQYFIQELCDNREVDANSFGMTIELDGATVTVLNPAGLEAFLGVIDTGARAASRSGGCVQGGRSGWLDGTAFE